jgi:hypothetical protein
MLKMAHLQLPFSVSLAATVAVEALHVERAGRRIVDLLRQCSMRGRCVWKCPAMGHVQIDRQDEQLELPWENLFA